MAHSVIITRNVVVATNMPYQRYRKEPRTDYA